MATLYFENKATPTRRHVLSGEFTAKTDGTVYPFDGYVEWSDSYGKWYSHPQLLVNWGPSYSMTSDAWGHAEYAYAKSRQTALQILEAYVSANWWFLLQEV